MAYNINHVKQEDKSGCGLACIAMLANKSYDEVKKVYLDLFEGKEEKLINSGNGAGLTFGEMTDLFHHFNLPGVRLVNAPCIVSVEGSGKNGLRHFIVVDSKGNVLDPKQG